MRAAAAFPALVLAAAVAAPACAVEIPFDDPHNELGGEGAIVVDPDHSAASADLTLRFTLLVGPSGIVQGGGFRVSLPTDPVHPFHGFTPPQIETWLQPGFIWCITRHAARQGPRAVASVGPSGEARCALKTGSLEAGDSMTLTYYGLAPRVAGPWRLAAEARFSGGRGGRSVARDPVFTVTPRPARALAAVLPSSAILGERVMLSLVALDEFGNRANDYRGPVRVTAGGEVHDIGSEAFKSGTADIALVPRGKGYLRVEVEETEGAEEYRLSARSNPASVSARGDPRSSELILWGDPHFHTGTGASGAAFLPRHRRAGDRRGNATSQEQAVAYARDVARLDFAAATEYAAPELYPEGWRASLAIAAQHEGRGSPPFTLLRGLAWRDRLVLFEGEPASDIDEDSRRTDEVAELRQAPAPTDYVEVLVEGARPDGGESGFEIYSWLNRGAGYDDAPERFEPALGWVDGAHEACGPTESLTVLAGSANHWGHPGTIDRTGLETGAGGLTAVVAAGRTPKEILAAIREGRTWATTGPRIILRADPSPDGRSVRVDAAGTATIARAALVLVESSGIRETPLVGTGALDLSATVPIPETEGPALWYIRVVQTDGAIAWSSPRCLAPE